MFCNIKSGVRCLQYKAKEIPTWDRFYKSTLVFLERYRSANVQAARGSDTRCIGIVRECETWAHYPRGWVASIVIPQLSSWSVVKGGKHIRVKRVIYRQNQKKKKRIKFNKTKYKKGLKYYMSTVKRARLAGWSRTAWVDRTSLGPLTYTVPPGGYTGPYL